VIEKERRRIWESGKREGGKVRKGYSAYFLFFLFDVSYIVL